MRYADECSTCDGLGCDLLNCRECGDEFDDPCDRHADHAELSPCPTGGCCPTCHGEKVHP